MANTNANTNKTSKTNNKSSGRKTGRSDTNGDAQTNNTKNTQTNTKNTQTTNSRQFNNQRRKSRKSTSFNSGIRTTHKAITGSSSILNDTPPNAIFLLGGSLLIASQAHNIKTLFQLVWSRQSNPTANRSSILAILKKIGVLVLFVVAITMTARIFKPLGTMWLIILVGMWLLFLERNPMLLQWLANLGGNVGQIEVAPSHSENGAVSSKNTHSPNQIIANTVSNAFNTINKHNVTN